MRRALASFAVTCLLASACVSNHRVSPFPPIETLHDILPPPDLDRQVSRIDDEASANGYRLRLEQRGRLREGGDIVVRGYVTVDPFGRVAHLTRVATPSGVVLALGPPDPKQVVPPAVELVPSLLSGGWSSGTDLNGDGAPEVIVRDGAGVLSAWRIEAYGATPLPIELAFPPAFALDVNGDGHPDFAGRAEVPEGDPLAPSFVDAAVFEGAVYTNRSDEVRAWHAKERERAKAEEEAATEEKKVPEALRAALERAFHSVRAGDDAKQALLELDRGVKERGPLSGELRSSFERWRAFLVGSDPSRER